MSNFLISIFGDRYVACKRQIWFCILKDFTVKENSVKLTAEPPSVEALVYQRGNTSLTYQNGQLALCKSANLLTDCTRKFSNFVFS